MKKRGLSRRSLFKYMAAGSGTAVAAGCQTKPEKILPLLVPPNDFEYKPHTSYQYMTTCGECTEGCGMMITTREGRAQKAEGNPNHPLSQGALCGQGQASLQGLYNPFRIKTPLSNKSAVSWDDAYAQFSKQLQSASGKTVYVSRPLMGSNQKFLKEWLDAVGGGSHIPFEVFSTCSAQTAADIAFGNNTKVQYTIEKASYLLSFGADFLETWGNSVDNGRQFAEMHAYNEKTKSKHKFVHVGPHVSLTGANADQWVSIKPGTEGLLALAMAHEIREHQRNYSFLAGFLSSYTPERVASEVGISAQKIKDLAHAFESHGPSLAIAGSNAIASESQTATLVAVHILNAVSGNLGETVHAIESTDTHSSSHQAIAELVKDLNAGKVKTVIFEDVNPIYALPPELGLQEALKKAQVISLASVQDETNAKAQLVLPVSTFYETWGDSFPKAGVYNLQQPVMAPVKGFDAKAREEVLLAVAQQVNTNAFSGLSSYKAYIQNEWRALHQKLGSTVPFESFWISALENGGVYVDVMAPKSKDLRPSATQTKPSAPKLEGKGLTLIPSNSIFMGDGSGANKPWLQEIPDPMTQIVWDSWMEINPETAKSMGIQDRDVVQVETSYGKFEVTAYYHFGIHPDAIAIPFGQGHENSGDVADHFGVNVAKVLPFKQDQLSGDLAWLSTRAVVKSTKQHSYTVNLDGNARQAGRSIAAAITLDELKKGVHHHKPHRPKEATEFYPPREETAGYYEPYRWGMTIDLDRCNGCSACVVACYAENNIPVVGKERAGIGREMSWLRIERYIEGYGEDFEVRFSPMTCQHCGNAGCEPVCPVYATYHNPEGLNSQVYNRCVGTRYCSNNCAYKVRRFNWFSYDFPEPLNQQLNSTITTRDVGVMEKCTFCVQRIREAQHLARNKGRDVQDGEVVTACQQTCSAKAITFGNLQDPQSQVSKLAKRDDLEHRDRQYESLAELNYKPAITYLKKVRLSGSNSHHA